MHCQSTLRGGHTDYHLLRLATLAVALVYDNTYGRLNSAGATLHLGHGKHRQKQTLDAYQQFSATTAFAIHTSRILQQLPSRASRTCCVYTLACPILTRQLPI